jgi:hypothetical protein
LEIDSISETLFNDWTFFFCYGDAQSSSSSSMKKEKEKAEEKQRTKKKVRLPLTPVLQVPG